MGGRISWVARSGGDGQIWGNGRKFETPMEGRIGCKGSQGRVRKKLKSKLENQHPSSRGMLYVMLCYGTLWHVMNGLPPSTIPWLCTTVSNLPAISDAILWKAGAADCEMWDGHRHKF
ncbi:hypothetical protein TIFTF001_041071 [Ficus carica]|uniref:Uncharacterized protein n=1 Tax=Ficus carica TaxID=3494 RepID=A0AA87ZAE1_FICCA|nr:hypothetical protein TIFTF001_041071 [Ficus carica]